jgi:hypothetical protein
MDEDDVAIHLPAKLSIPLIPGAVLVYMSIYVLFLAGPFIVRERREFATLIGSLAVATLIGAIGFLLVPAHAAFPPPGDLGIWTNLFHFADRLNLNYNMVPSLHVETFSLATATTPTCRKQSSGSRGL